MLTVALAPMLALFSAAPALTSCPTGIPSTATCYTGWDANGAFYAIAVPNHWNHTLVMFDHGGPGLKPNAPLTLATDYASGLSAALLNRGVALAATGYRDQFLDVSVYAQDTENLRQLFVNRFGAATRTLLYGLSFGGNVAMKTAEIYGDHYNGVVLDSGVVGGTLANMFSWMDFRAVYQYYCGDPWSTTTSYPLYLGINVDKISTYRANIFTAARARILAAARQCTGYDLSASSRTPAQARALANILGVTHLAPASFPIWMVNSTIGLNALALSQTGGLNVFTNAHVRYSGSDDDLTLNRNVQRYDSDAKAVEHVREDSAPTGQIHIPVVTMHSINDTHVPVQHEWVLRHAMVQAGTDDNLLQVFTNRTSHPGGTPAERLTSFDLLGRWLDAGVRPSDTDAPQLCAATATAFTGVNASCSGYVLGYEAPSMFTLIPREGRTELFNVLDQRLRR